ncbi:hypothetical protein MMC26_005461 [Xylographa opegraphella]|nr:hypothetical protein [Xylographa opegraphella]
MVWTWLRHKLTFIVPIEAATPYSPSSPTTNSSDTTSPVYPERPIRPLPKRPLRSRLSPEVADSIHYPPAPPSSSLFYPYGKAAYRQSATPVKSEVEEADNVLANSQKVCNGDTKNGYRFRGSDLESDEEDGLGLIRRYEDQQRQTMMKTPSRGYSNGVNRTQDPLSHSAVSSNESVDGYDSFENTNNKKKRKIPTSGSIANHHSSLSAEMANMGISPTHDLGANPVTPENTSSQYYGSVGSNAASSIPGTGIFGAGRGRYGRSGRRDTSGRSPLGVSTNASNAWQLGRLNSRRDFIPTSNHPGKSRDIPSEHGIISAAMAEAASTSNTFSKGQENLSLLEQSAAKKSTPSKTQFTFTCESGSSKHMVWPGERPPMSTTSSAIPGQQSSHHAKGFSTQGTQTSPTMAGQANQNGAPLGKTNAQNPQQPRKPKRPPGKRYAMAARERRLQQEYTNYHHPPRDEDIWICEFCEYESIFGSPPEALVRQYEIKDRRERKRLAEKRRLLEKAKMKGRKGKKGNKNAAKNVAAAANPQAHQAAVQQSFPQPDTTPVQSHGTQSEEYFGEDYDDDPVPVPNPSSQAPTKIPQPVAQHYGHSTRTAHTNGTAVFREGQISSVA